MCIYYDTLKRTLSEMPFNITDKTELEKLSKYLIEDEDEEEDITDDSKQYIEIVKSIFNKLLGHYENKTEREFRLVNQSILDVDFGPHRAH